LAAARGWHDVVDKLLQWHSDVEARNHAGNTALTEAAQAGHTAVVRLLLANHAVVDPRNNRNETPLLLAAVSGREEIVDINVGGTITGIPRQV